MLPFFRPNCSFRRPRLSVVPHSLMPLMPLMRHPSGRTAGFTLIELLTVIAIIGILAAIIIPTVGTVREKAQRAVDSNNLREIIKAAQIYAGDNNDRLPDLRTIPATVLTNATQALLWPGILARNNILTDATFWFSKSDPFFAGRPASTCSQK